MIKVACIGNMNNNFFSFVRYLRDMGMSADLLIRNNEMNHFYPQADSYSNVNRDYIKKLSWGHVLTYYSTPKNRIKNDLSRYDFLIACGTVPAFLEKIGRTLDLFIPYGADLYGFPFCRFPFYLPIFIHFSKSQKKGIQASRYLSMDITNDIMEKAFNRIAFTGKRVTFGLPMIYLPEYKTININRYLDQNPYAKKFEEIRNQHDLVIFHQTRLNWKTSPDSFTWKGNDKLVKGFANFVKKHHKKVSSALVIIEYGTDVNETKKLIKELDIESHVYWFPKMMRKELMMGLGMADIGTGEFHNSWLSCGTIYESLAMGKPLMHYREDNLYKDHYPELYPMINVKTSEDIAQSLADYVRRPDYYKEMGIKGRRWYDYYVVKKPIEEYLYLINNSA